MKRYFDTFPREQIRTYLFDDFKKDSKAVVQDLYGFVGVDTGFTPDTAVRHNPANVPKSALLNRVFYHPRAIRSAKAVLPDRLQTMAKRLRQRTQRPAPKLPPDLRARLLELYRDDIRKLETLLDRDLSVWLEQA
jgi:hypothetical protein